MSNIVVLNFVGAILIVAGLVVVLRVAHHVASGRLLADPERAGGVSAQAVERRAA
jgi:hypothetical protein